MAKRILTLSFRPSSFEGLIGQSKLVKLIRSHHKSGRMPAAWLFSGDTGAGKTTIARILALALQCKHQQEFGNPCDVCKSRSKEFDITEINASEASGVAEIGELVKSAGYFPQEGSKKKVFILDEAQRLSSAAQNLLLKYFEDSPKSTVWIICTTEPRNILRTLRSRCLHYSIQPLSMEAMTKLVKKAISLGDGTLPADPLVECLMEANVYSPRLVVLAVEKYLAGAEPKEAVLVTQDSSVDGLRVSKCVVRGDWDGVRGLIKFLTPDDARAVRVQVAGYLRSILLGSDGTQAKRAAESINDLVRLSYDNEMLAPSLSAALFTICRRYSRE